MAPLKSAKDLIILSQKQLGSAMIIQFKNLIILSITLIGLSIYFFHLSHFQETTSHIGISLMTGGLAIRILIEGYSIIKSNGIDISQSLNDFNSGYLTYYHYRKRIHGPVTIGILLSYTIGFYLLMPEFDQHLPRETIIWFALSYLPAATIFGLSIRKAIRDEMGLLNEMLAMQEEIRGLEATD